MEPREQRPKGGNGSKPYGYPEKEDCVQRKQQGDLARKLSYYISE